MTLLAPAATFLDEVARFGSIRKAAERLNISPSALNRRILNLEEEYGVQLFERLPRGMRLTAAGELLVGDIRRWRTELDRSRVRLQQMQGLRRGHVSIGLMECLAGSFMNTAFAALGSQHPGLTLDIFVGGTGEVTTRLANGQLDVAICFNVASRNEISKLLSFEVPAGIVVAPHHPLAGRASVRLGDCADHPFILPDMSLATRSLIDRALAASGLQPVPRVVTNSTRLMRMLVGDGRHLALLGAVDLIDDLAEGRLKFIPLAGSHVPSEELSLITRNSHGASPAVGAVSTLLRQQLLALMPGVTGAA